MKKIMMNKYGFERWQAEDFSDDGNRFYCYKAGKRVRVSKLVSDGRVYISARIDDIKLPYEVYSKLPHYKLLDKLNGVSLNSINDFDLITLYNDCLAYEKEYTDAENSIVMPTLKELEDHCKTIRAIRQSEIDVIEHLLKTNVIVLMENLSNYKWSKLKESYEDLVLSKDHYSPTFAAKVLGTQHSFELCKADYYAKKESYYYSDLMEIIKSAVKGDE